MGSMGVWARGWCESNFGMGRVGHIVPQNFGGSKTKWQGSKFWCGLNT